MVAVILLKVVFVAALVPARLVLVVDTPVPVPVPVPPPRRAPEGFRTPGARTLKVANSPTVMPKPGKKLSGCTLGALRMVAKMARLSFTCRACTWSANAR